ncbi:MAG: putative toxin-antitoxin system toxin component, PIN family [Acetobacteraceae bacterium]|nr:putative toxin-antitoxin system toxin component, PIN family [Acetobacteraceae bacterium]
MAPKIAPFFLDRVRQVFAAAELVIVTEAVTECRDPMDDKFLELAVNGRADPIITGDTDLLVLNPFRGIPIITPAAFGHALALDR